EDPVLAVVHQHGKVDDDFVLGLSQDRLHVGLQVDELGGLVQVALNDLEKLVLFSRRRLAQTRLAWGARGSGLHAVHHPSYDARRQKVTQPKRIPKPTPAPRDSSIRGSFRLRVAAAPAR